MSRRKQGTIVKLEKTLLIVKGQFIVTTVKSVELHLLSDSQTDQFWEGLRLAEDTVRAEDNRAYVIRQAFGGKALEFIPASSTEALLHYAQNYTGRHTDEVKGFCACILTGHAFGPNEDGPSIDGGGLKVAAPKPSPAPSGPTGAHFDIAVQARE